MSDYEIMTEQLKYFCEQLMDQVRKNIQLELEANWLAHKLSNYYQVIDRRCNGGTMADCRTGCDYWRNEARKAVSDNGNA